MKIILLVFIIITLVVPIKKRNIIGDGLDYIDVDEAQATIINTSALHMW